MPASFKIFFLATFVLACIPGIAEPNTSGSGSGSESDQKALLEQLRAIQDEISGFQELLDETKGERSKLEQSLKDNEKGISDLIKNIEEIQRELDRGQQSLEQLDEEQSQLLDRKAEQQKQIALQIQAAYKLGQQEYLKVLLNQEDPATLSRMLKYYDYLNLARADQINQFEETLASLEAVEQKIATETTNLANQKVIEAKELENLVAKRKQREATVSQLTLVIASTGTELEKRVEDREQLEQLLTRIQQGVAGLSGPAETAPFASLRGKLAFPVDGAITHRFGSTRTGNVAWDGVYIAAGAGDSVTAVYYGQVVFADWLRGFGLLLIINHGDGYMSLYGHNEVLYRETGDWVAAGEVVATIGNTGGQNSTGLYFEIRYDGKPTDPQLWCQAKPRTA